MPNYRPFANEGRPVFATLVAMDRAPWLTRRETVAALLASLRVAQMREGFRHHAHCILPDHLHLLVTPAPGTTLSRIVSALKRDLHWFGRAPGRTTTIGRWQPRFYDHVIRDAQDMRRHLDYVHFNPVKHGLVRCAGDWPHSTLSAWTARGAYEARWGTAAPTGIENMDIE